MFLAVALSILAGLHAYVWWRVVRTPEWPSWLSRMGGASLALGAFTMLLGFMVARGDPTARFRAPIAALGFSWLGVVFLLLTAIACWDVLLLLWRLSSATAIDPERRLFLWRLASGLSIFATVGLSSVALWRGLQAPRVHHVPMTLSRWPRDFPKFRLVQLSDIHVGPTIGAGFLGEVVAQVNALQPDLIAITGDLVDGPVRDLASQVAPLADLRATHGTFFVTGNHEYYSGAAAWTAHLRTLGIHVLDNSCVEVSGFCLAGVPDVHAPRFGGDRPDVALAVAQRRDGLATILLAHRPRMAQHASAHGVDLQLSGHTHGGQIWPFGLWVRFTEPYLQGLHQHAGTQVYVSPGTGYWGPPMRLGTHSEITLFEISAPS